MPLPCAVRVVAVRQCQYRPLAHEVGRFVCPKGLRRGRDLAERFELYQIVLNRVDLYSVAILVYAKLQEYVLNCFKWFCQ